MIFLLALLVVLGGVIVCVVHDRLRGRHPSRMIMVGLVVLWGLGSASILWLSFVAAHARHPGYANLAVPGFLLLGLVGTALYSRLIWTARHGSFLALGTPFLATVASVYIVGACLSPCRRRPVPSEPTTPMFKPVLCASLPYLSLAFSMVELSL